jgi:glycosyltransferase involved in cell wall biosynthesis
MNGMPDLSVIVPLLDEEENVFPLVDRVKSALGETRSWELILVNDGSKDRTGEFVALAAESDSRIRPVSLQRRYGQSTAMQAGFDHARGCVFVTMDGDLQNDPMDIPKLVAELEKGWDLVAGYRERRQDMLVRRKIPSWFANRIIAWITGVRMRDNGCSLKAYRREVLDRVYLYSDMHRFIPALAVGMAGARITQIPVRHHARLRGKSKYGLSRVGKVLVDLLTVKMIQSFRLSPARMLGGGAVSAALVGVVSGALAMRGYGSLDDRIADSVVLAGVTLIWFSLATYLLMLGLVGQVAVSASQTEGRDSGPLLHEVKP